MHSFGLSDFSLAKGLLSPSADLKPLSSDDVLLVNLFFNVQLFLN